MGKRKKKKLKKPKFEITETSHRKVHSESSIVEGALKYIEYSTILYEFNGHALLYCCLIIIHY